MFHCMFYFTCDRSFTRYHDTDLVPDTMPQRRRRGSPDVRRRSHLGDQSTVTVEHVDERSRHEVHTVHQRVGTHLEAQRETSRTVVEVSVAGRLSSPHLDVLVAAVELETIADHSRRRRRSVDDVDDVLVMDKHVSVDAIHVKDHSTNVYSNQPQKLL